MGYLVKWTTLKSLLIRYLAINPWSWPANAPWKFNFHMTYNKLVVGCIAKVTKLGLKQFRPRQSPGYLTNFCWNIYLVRSRPSTLRFITPFCASISHLSNLTAFLQQAGPRARGSIVLLFLSENLYPRDRTRPKLKYQECQRRMAFIIRYKARITPEKNISICWRTRWVTNISQLLS